MFILYFNIIITTIIHPVYLRALTWLVRKNMVSITKEKYVKIERIIIIVPHSAVMIILPSLSRQTSFRSVYIGFTEKQTISGSHSIFSNKVISIVFLPTSYGFFFHYTSNTPQRINIIF